jgi:transposase
MLTALGSKEAEMKIIGCDLHASQQSIAMLDRDTGEIVEKTLTDEGGAVRAFYAAIPPPVVVGIEATGSMSWFLRLMEELAIECRVGHPTAIRKAETRQQSTAIMRGRPDERAVSRITSARASAAHPR